MSRYALELRYINIKVCSQCFYLIYLYGQGLLPRADLYLCTMLLLTSPTFFCSPSIVFNKTIGTCACSSQKHYYDLLQVHAEMVLKLSISQLIKLSVMVHELSFLEITYSSTLVFPK